MKTDESLYNVTIAAVKRKTIDTEGWLYSKIIENGVTERFELMENELPIFHFKSPDTENLITTRRIIEISGDAVVSVHIADIKESDYGRPKGNPYKPPAISNFIVTTKQGGKLAFSMETGKAAIGLIYSLDTLMGLHR